MENIEIIATPEQVKQKRLEFGLTQEKMAEMLGIEISTWQEWEEGAMPEPLWQWLTVKREVVVVFLSEDSASEQIQYTFSNGHICTKEISSAEGGEWSLREKKEWWQQYYDVFLECMNRDYHEQLRTAAILGKVSQALGSDWEWLLSEELKRRRKSSKHERSCSKGQIMKMCDGNVIVYNSKPYECA